MKSKAHSKKCQETGVPEELEAEEGTELAVPDPSLIWALFFSACSFTLPPSILFCPFLPAMPFPPLETPFGNPG